MGWRGGRVTEEHEREGSQRGGCEGQRAKGEGQRAKGK